MNDTKANRDYQYLATAILLIAGFSAYRACANLPRAIQMFQDLGLELSGLSQWLFEHYSLPLPLMLVVWLVSMVSVWWRYRLHSLVVAVGLILLALGSHLLSIAASEPLQNMISDMAN